MATVTLTDVDVTAGQIVALPVTLRAEAEVREKIKVVGRPEIVNLDSTTAQTSFSAEFIEGLPILGRNYQDILTLAPGVSDVDGDGKPITQPFEPAAGEPDAQEKSSALAGRRRAKAVEKGTDVAPWFDR
jgi:hypothetical protein